MRSYLSDQRGNIFLLTLFIVLVIAVFTPVVLQTSLQGYKNVLRSGEEAQALSLAEGALEIGYRVLLTRHEKDAFLLYESNDVDRLINQAKWAVSNESSQLKLETSPIVSSNGVYRFTLTGKATVGEVTRSVNSNVIITTANIGGSLVIHKNAEPSFVSLRNKNLQPNLVNGASMPPPIGDTSPLMRIKPANDNSWVLLDLKNSIPTSCSSAICSGSAASIDGKVIKADTVYLLINQNSNIPVNQFIICNTLHFAMTNNGNPQTLASLNNGLIVFKEFVNQEIPVNIAKPTWVVPDQRGISITISSTNVNTDSNVSNLKIQY
ncbi:hypothetical protein [Ammoniphilus sp. 3BR4]|uniref:hypothetical protein n=1 Tax=Ammoniphilus sp. 3BR4 TaxID=3158265 RepID=UPI003466BB69